jgi:hypothetical protein
MADMTDRGSTPRRLQRLPRSTGVRLSSARRALRSARVRLATARAGFLLRWASLTAARLLGPFAVQWIGGVAVNVGIVAGLYMVLFPFGEGLMRFPLALLGGLTGLALALGGARLLSVRPGEGLSADEAAELAGPRVRGGLDRVRSALQEVADALADEPRRERDRGRLTVLPEDRSQCGRLSTAAAGRLALDRR